MKKSKHTLTPKLRFPEFRKQWGEVQLSQLANLISDRVGTMPCIPYTVTSGLGLVSQEEKLGRTIAGNSLRNYIRLQKGDFAYNKSATKAYPEGYIARYLDEAKAAVPNSIFTCFRVDSEKVEPAYLDFLFAGNLHGRWLRKFLTIGARAHGALNVSDDDLMALPVPRPSPPEQKKIAECLSSLDGLIAAEDRMLEALKAHKKGLMQQLFPQPGQTQPRLRFPEFRDKGEWEENILGAMSESISSGRDKVNAQGEFDLYGSTGVIGKTSNGTFNGRFILVARVGANAGLLTMAQGNFGVTDNTLVIVLNHAQNIDFLFQYLGNFGLNKLIFGSGQPLITGKQLKTLKIRHPKKQEQQKIADCLTALDTRIDAQAAKIDALKQHKRGLMQQLFPAPEEQ